jgi:hypothetical protein
MLVCFAHPETTRITAVFSEYLWWLYSHLRIFIHNDRGALVDQWRLFTRDCLSEGILLTNQFALDRLKLSLPRKVERSTLNFHEFYLLRFILSKDLSTVDWKLSCASFCYLWPGSIHQGNSVMVHTGLQDGWLCLAFCAQLPNFIWNIGRLHPAYLCGLMPS